MLIILIRSVILYFLTIFAIRLMGKRQLGELQPSELVVTILISNIATLSLEETDTPLIAGFFPILTLVCLDIVMSWITLKSRTIRHIVSGKPKILIQDGRIDQRLLGELRLSVDDLFGAMRENAIFRIDEVQLAIAETTGKINFYQKFGAQNVTNDGLGIKGSSDNPPEIVINDGKLDSEALGRTGFGKGWLESRIRESDVSESDIFIMTVDSCGASSIIRKSKGQNKQKKGASEK